MGLDQYAYAALRSGQRHDFYESGEFVDGDWRNTSVAQPVEISYWRKHPNLQGWMEKLAQEKNLEYTVFNGVELELTYQDLEQLEQDINNGRVANLGTTGFFFGEASDDEYYEHDLNFCREARFHLLHGLRVFYNSSW